MEYYSRSLKYIMEIRKPEDRTEPPVKLKMKPFRKMTGQIAWLAKAPGQIFVTRLLRCPR